LAVDETAQQTYSQDADKKKHLLHQALALADTAQMYYNLRIEFALIFQMAEVAVPRELFRAILEKIESLRLATAATG
jgi:hypothetical protein